MHKSLFLKIFSDIWVPLLASDLFYNSNLYYWKLLLINGKSVSFPLWSIHLLEFFQIFSIIKELEFNSLYMWTIFQWLPFLSYCIAILLHLRTIYSMLDSSYFVYYPFEKLFIERSFSCSSLSNKDIFSYSL